METTNGSLCSIPVPSLEDLELVEVHPGKNSNADIVNPGKVYQSDADVPKAGSRTSRTKSVPFVTYGFVMWLVHGVLVALACADRFTWNVWPRQETFNISGKPAGWDKTDGLLDGPWSVKLYDVIVRTSGRFTILTLNLILFVRLRTIESWLATSWVSRHLIDCSNIVNANLRLHIWNGWAITFLMLMHVWSIVLPCIFHGYSAGIDPGPFEWPLSERRESDFKDVDVIAKTVSFQIDDILKLLTASICLGIVAPLSYYWFSSCWNVAIFLHRLMAIIFCVEMIRRYAHPHSMILNTPFILLWIIDKVIFYVQDHSSLAQFQKTMLGEDYMVVMWKGGRISKALGSNFYLKLRDSSVLESDHVFTAFQNRRGVHVRTAPGGWTTGMVIRVYRNKRKCFLVRGEKQSHTGRMADEHPAVIEARGPYIGEMSALLATQNRARSRFSALVQDYLRLGCPSSVTKSFQRDGSVVLVGTGSGINYLLDATQYHFTCDKQFIILWSTGDDFLFNWVRKFIEETLTPEATHLKIILYNTKREISSDEFNNSYPSIVQYVTGRIPFEKEVPHNSQIFFQGSESVRKAMCKACKKKECSMTIWRGRNYIRKEKLWNIAHKSLVYVNQNIGRPSSTGSSHNDPAQKTDPIEFL